MIPVEIPANLTKDERYRLISARLAALAAAERDPLANLCNFMAYLYWTVGDVNWVGLYLLRGGELVLGPFAGKPACSRLAPGKGVCGAAVRAGKSQLVPDVRAFPGPIACDDASRYELVVQLTVGCRTCGVLDLDSPEPARFDETDRAALEKIAAQIEAQAARL